MVYMNMAFAMIEAKLVIMDKPCTMPKFLPAFCKPSSSPGVSLLMSSRSVKYLTFSGNRIHKLIKLLTRATIKHGRGYGYQYWDKGRNGSSLIKQINPKSEVQLKNRACLKKKKLIGLV